MSAATINPKIISVAVPVPLRQPFDFLEPLKPYELIVGARIRVPFGNRVLIGLIVEIKGESDVPKAKLKHALDVLDNDSIFDAKLWSTLQWLASYYLAPIGEVLEGAMPSKIRQGGTQAPASLKTWSMSEKGRSLPIEQLQRAPLQLAIIKRFMQSEVLTSVDFNNDSSSWRQAIKALIEKQWIVETEQLPSLSSSEQTELKNNREFKLNTDQQHAITTISNLIERSEFSCSLLHGVTGSGKTEVYFDLMQKVLEIDQQVLFLVPEIGLTPQLIERVQNRFSYSMVVMHSGLNDSERHHAWWHAKQGNAQIVIGTRSAVFTSFTNLGLIVIDEEHDASFKQQDGVRYQARDVAIYRAKLEKIPIVLGSATPSLETYHNAQRDRYQYLRLDKRATKAALPTIEIFDTNKLPSSDGLSPPMLEAITKTLDSGKQVMLFLNRRGYAPVLYCSDCGETSKCHRCDAHLTLHRRANRLRCHHCGFEATANTKCNSCKQDSMVEVGEGTQRVEEAVTLRFPKARVLRIDRDTTRRKGELARLLEQARNGDADIILGTQLLTKGHDFPNVAMVGILGADQGLYSTDFRASETLFQQIVQVSGRAGRRDSVGSVFIQTAFPDHPFFTWVCKHDYDGFADSLLAERNSVAYPPYGYFALLRAESVHQAKALQFLRRAKIDIKPQSGVRIMDAIPAPMERRAGRYRAQLLICADQRSFLNKSLSEWLKKLKEDNSARKLAASVRWSLDVDPYDLY